MSHARDLRPLGDDPDPGRRAREIAPWVHEAATPYLDWMLGSAGLARTAVERWIGQDRSELSLTRAVGLYEQDAVVGGYVGISGADLAGVAKADTLSLLAVVPRADRPGVLDRATALSALRRPVEPDQWFLSKLGVLESHRRGGRGRAVLEHFLDAGRVRGLRQFRVDAWEPDAHVVAMYEAAGFATVARAESAELGGALLAMTLEEDT